MTTINWKLGLIRLWIACTLVWVTLMFFFVRPDDSYREYLAAKGFQEENEFKSRARKEKLVAPGSNEINLGNKKIDIGDVPTPHVYFIPDNFSELEPIETSSRRRQYRWSAFKYKVWSFVEVAFLPPLLALLLGISGLWVLRGFKQPKAAVASSEKDE